MDGLHALLIEISFFKAHFRVHYTETTRLSYPAPLPTSVAGIFGAMLGWERNKGYPEGLLYGAKILKVGKPFFEAITYHQLGSSVWLKGVATAEILSEPSYVIAVASMDVKQLEAWSLKLFSDEFEFLPYGGQNDFFVKDIRVLGINHVINDNLIEGYAPSSWVKEILTDQRGSAVSILPVSYRPRVRESFVFAMGGARALLNREVQSVDRIPLYPLEDFYSVVG